MTAINLANLTVVTNKEFQEPLADLIARSNPFLRAIRKRKVYTDKLYLKTKMTSTHNARAIADGTDLFPVPTGASSTTLGYPSPTVGSAYVGGYLDWATYVAEFAVPKRLIEQLASQPKNIGDILWNEISDAAKDLADQIGLDMWGGVTTNGLVGMANIIDNGSVAHTYAGITRYTSAPGDTNPNFSSAVLDLSTGGQSPAPGYISTANLYKLDDLFFAKNKYGFRENPERFTGIISPGVMTKYTQLLENIDLSSLSTAHFVNQVNQSGFLGKSTVGFLGVPFLREPNMQSTDVGDLANSGRIYFVDMDYVDLCIMQPGNAEDAYFQQVAGYQEAPETSGIYSTIEFLGNTGEMIRGYVKVYLQLACNDPKRAGALLKNIGTA